MTTLREGDIAPEFTGTTDSGEQISLSDYRGSKVVLFFYPKDDTPGCTAEACSLRDSYSDLQDRGYELIGVSPDSINRHQKFKTKYSLPFPLISDEEHSILNAYGVWGPKQFMGRTFDGVHRTTFIIDEEGRIERIITNVKTKDHGSQILEPA